MGVIFDELSNNINLETGATLAAAIIQTNTERILMITIHHFVVDFVSWRIIEEDFKMSLTQLEMDQRIKLSPKTASYKLWSEKLHEYTLSSEFEKECAYWKEVDNTIEEYQIYDGTGIEYRHKKCTLIIDSQSTEDLILNSGKAYSTKPDEVVLAAFVRSMANIIDSEILFIDMESYGRSRDVLNIDVDRTVGWFTSIYPICIEDSENLSELLISCKETLRRVPYLGIGYGLYREKEGKSQKSSSNIQFNYLGDTTANESEVIAITDFAQSLHNNNVLPYDMICNAEIKNGRLLCEFQYDVLTYSKDKIETLKDCFENTNIIFKNPEHTFKFANNFEF